MRAYPPRVPSLTQAFDLVNVLPEGAWAVVNNRICHAAISVLSIDSDNSELVVAFIPTTQRLLWRQKNTNTVHLEDLTKWELNILF